MLCFVSDYEVIQVKVGVILKAERRWRQKQMMKRRLLEIEAETTTLFTIIYPKQAICRHPLTQGTIS